MSKKTAFAGKTLVCVLLCCSLIMLNIVSVPAQTLPENPNKASRQLDAKAQEIKDKVTKIGQGNDITLIMKNGQQFYGSVTSIESDLVLISEVDQRRLIEVGYWEIRKVRKGYGVSRNRFGNRIPTGRNATALIILSGLLILPFILLAASKD